MSKTLAVSFSNKVLKGFLPTYRYSIKLSELDKVDTSIVSTAFIAKPSDSLYKTSISVIFKSLKRDVCATGNGICNPIELTLFSIKLTILDSAV